MIKRWPTAGKNRRRGQQKVDVITNPETTAASPDMAIPFGLKFSGYARYGAHFQTGDQKYVGVDGSYNGASAIGRLGNESNGGEFQISKAFKSAQGLSGILT